MSKTKNHVKLMQDFLRAIGIDDEQRDEAVALPATQEWIDYRMDAVKDPKRYHVGAAAVTIASEGQNLETLGSESRDIRSTWLAACRHVDASGDRHQDGGGGKPYPSDDAGGGSALSRRPESCPRCPAPEHDFVAMFHGVDERVPVEALNFGVRVLDRFLRSS